MPLHEPNAYGGVGFKGVSPEATPTSEPATSKPPAKRPSSRKKATVASEVDTN